MADIFISYSKADRDLTVKLAAFLEAEGWTVWWDKSLKAADSYRDEIMQELAKARAVITIWTENSINSDWVRAEAGRAKADGKLIPLKTSSVAYDAIPLPFGEMHTEDVSKTDLVRAAVVAQLAKPEVAPSALRTSIKTLRYQALTWCGVIGGAITLFSNLGGLVRMADWAQWLVIHWHTWTQAIWTWLFSWIGIQFPYELAPTLSFLFFIVVLSIGVKMRAVFFARRGEPYRNHVRRPFVKILMALAVIVFSAFMAFGPILRFGSDAAAPLLLVLPLVSAYLFVIVISQERLKSITSLLLMTIFAFVIAIVPIIDLTIEGEHAKRLQENGLGELANYLRQPDADIMLFAKSIQFIVFPLLFVAVVIWTPAAGLTKRLFSIGIGLIVLMLLNGIAQYDLQSLLQAPK